MIDAKEENIFIHHHIKKAPHSLTLNCSVHKHTYVTNIYINSLSNRFNSTTLWTSIGLKMLNIKKSLLVHVYFSLPVCVCVCLLFAHSETINGMKINVNPIGMTLPMPPSRTHTHILFLSSSHFLHFSFDPSISLLKYSLKFAFRNFIVQHFQKWFNYGAIRRE